MRALLHVTFKWTEQTPTEAHECFGCNEQIYLIEHSLDIQCWLLGRTGGFRPTGIYCCNSCKNQCDDVAAGEGWKQST